MNLSGFVPGCMGPTNVSLTNALWVELDTMRFRWSSAWCLFGDFITIRYTVERFGCTSFSPDMFKFLDFIKKHSLVDLPLTGVDYTWFWGSNNPSMSRINRVFISTEWEDHFLDVTQRLALFLWRRVVCRGGRVLSNLRICG